VTTEWIQEIEQRREQLPRRIKIRKYFIYSPHPSLLPEGEGAKLLNLTGIVPEGEGRVRVIKIAVFSLLAPLIPLEYRSR
jgi:hypothetical protein